MYFHTTIGTSIKTFKQMTRCSKITVKIRAIFLACSYLSNASNIAQPGRGVLQLLEVDLSLFPNLPGL